MQQNLEAPERRNTVDPGADQSQRTLRNHAVQEMLTAGSKDFRASPTADRQLQKLIDSGHNNIECLRTTKDGGSDFKIKYPANAEGKQTSIRLKVDAVGNLTAIGNKLVKENGVWRSGHNGPEAKYQNNSFDLTTGRYTYQTDKNEGKWIDPDGSSGKVNFNGNGARAYFSPEGKHEFTIRPDGSKYDVATKTISGAPERFVNQPNGRAHIGTDGKHDYTLGNDGSRLDMLSRTRTKPLTDGRSEVVQIDTGGRMVKDRRGRIESIGKSEYNQIQFDYDSKNKVSKATKWVDGKREVVWDRRTAGSSTAEVDKKDGRLIITRNDHSRTTYDSLLTKRDYDADSAKPSNIVKANGEERHIDPAGNIVDTYRRHGREVTRTISADQVTTRSENIHTRRNSHPVESQQSLPANISRNVDEQGNLTLATQQRNYQLRLADMHHIKQIRRNR